MTLTADFVTGKTETFRQMRVLLSMLEGMQEGVVGAGDLKVAQRAAGGANMSVDIPAGDAWIDVDSGVRSGRAHIYSDALENRAVAASHATLPRIDYVIARYNDTSIPAGAGGDVPTLEVLTGTPTASVTQDAPGVSPPALPNDAILIAQLIVPAASTSVVAANIRDRRKWARGARTMMQRATGSLAVGAAAWAVLDSAFTHRVECSGAPIVIEFDPTVIQVAANAAISIQTQPYVDGAQVLGADPWLDAANASAIYVSDTKRWVMTPAAGSHLIDLRYQVSGGGFNVNIGGKSQFSVMEDPRPLTNNGTV